MGDVYAFEGSSSDEAEQKSEGLRRSHKSSSEKKKKKEPRTAIEYFEESQSLEYSSGSGSARRSPRHDIPGDKIIFQSKRMSGDERKEAAEKGRNLNMRERGGGPPESNGGDEEGFYFEGMGEDHTAADEAKRTFKSVGGVEDGADAEMDIFGDSGVNE